MRVIGGRARVSQLLVAGLELNVNSAKRPSYHIRIQTFMIEVNLIGERAISFKLMFSHMGDSYLLYRTIYSIIQRKIVRCDINYIQIVIE